MIPTLLVILLIVAVAIIIVIIASNYENKKLVTEHYKITSPKVPEAFDGSRIVFLTDLHCNEFGNYNQELLEQIDACKPDVILVGGDMVVSRVESSLDVPLQLMKQLTDKYPVYYSDGNHELKLKWNEETYGLRYKEYIHQLKEYGVVHMSNETFLLQQNGAYICLSALDLEKKFYRRFRIPEMTKQDILDAVGKEPPSAFRILLAHNPNYFKTYAEWGSNLVLCGHFHGGMVRIPGVGGVISPQFQLFPKYDAGEYQIDQSIMVLSRGLGNHSIKIRLWNKPEISCITLEKQRT